MRTHTLFLFAGVAAASWFGADSKDPSTWSAAQLKDWLNDHNIYAPNGYDTARLADLVKANYNEGASWTQDQYEKSQKAFADVRQSSFDTWDESRLRQFLLEQGVVAPNSKTEELRVLANKQYKGYKYAAMSYASQASATATDVYNTVSASASSIIAQATTPVVRTIDESKDYVYSTWSDSDMHAYLVEKGVIKTDAEVTRDKLLGKMKESYATVSSPIWEAWSDSYLHEWLVAHGIIKSDYEKKRDKLTGLMNDYYYGANDYVYSSWDDSTLKSWLVEHNVIKSDAEVTRDKMLKLVQDNYNTATDTVYGGWKDSDMRQWLIDNGYMRSDAQVKRDELVALMQSKYDSAAARAATYTAWPDARLRAFLRNNGVTEAAVPKTRTDLLRETRIRWVQTQWASQSMYQRIKATLADNVDSAEGKLGKILDILSGAKHDVGAAGAKATHRAKNEL